MDAKTYFDYLLFINSFSMCSVLDAKMDITVEAVIVHHQVNRVLKLTL